MFAFSHVVRNESTLLWAQFRLWFHCLPSIKQMEEWIRNKNMTRERASEKASFGLFSFYNVDVKSKNIIDPKMERWKKQQRIIARDAAVSIVTAWTLFVLLFLPTLFAHRISCSNFACSSIQSAHYYKAHHGVAHPLLCCSLIESRVFDWVLDLALKISKLL